MEYRNVPRQLVPTYENVFRLFVTEKLHKLMVREDSSLLIFKFQEKEAIDLIEKKLDETVKQKLIERSEYREVMDYLIHDKEDDKPVMVISDYKRFFNSLTKLYEINIQKFFDNYGTMDFPRTEKDNFLDYIWLRATPDDFKHPEDFLDKQIEMAEDTTFDKYLRETYVGIIDFYDNDILCARKSTGTVFEECYNQMEFTIYDKQYYDNLFINPSYTLPIIRYGIYEHEGKKKCVIGSIQNKDVDNTSFELSDDEKIVKEVTKLLKKKIDRAKYKVNEGVSEGDKYQVEPNKLIALSMFINTLQKEGITDIEIPCLYVLDHRYHEIRAEELQYQFGIIWSKEAARELPEAFREASLFLDKNVNNEDLISEIKSERFIATVVRVLKHYTNGEITSYPGDSDSNLHISIPIVKSDEEIKGTIFKKLYNIQNEKQDYRKSNL